MRKLITTILLSSSLLVFSQGEDIGHPRPTGSSPYGLNINQPTNGSGTGLDGPTYTNFQIATRGWSGSHAILFNAFASQNMVSGSLGTTGNTKYANNVGSYTSGAGAIMYYGNGGTMDFLISPNSTGAGNDIVWGTPKMRIKRDGNVGIGTGTPSERLHVNGNTQVEGVVTIKGNQIRFSEARGIDYDPSLDAIFYNGYNNGQVAMISDKDGNGWFSGNIGVGTTTPESKLHILGAGEQSIKLWSEDSKTEIHFRKNGTSNDGKIMYHTDGRMSFNLDGSNAGGVGSNEFLTIKNTGNIGIGTTTPSEKLEVNGTIRAKEVKVEASPWPDYVFSSDYELMPLEEIEKFIQSNHHLPEVPSAQEIESNGLQLGEMNSLLLKKIEELTLHTIAQQRLIEKIKAEKDDEIEELKTMIKHLINE